MGTWLLPPCAPTFDRNYFVSVRFTPAMDATPRTAGTTIATTAAAFSRNTRALSSVSLIALPPFWCNNTENKCGRTMTPNVMCIITPL